VGGAVLGGVLTGSLGASSALLVDAASFFGIAVILAFTSGLPDSAPVAGRVSQRLREGLTHIRRNAKLRSLVFGEALALLFFTLVVPIEVVYARETLDSTAAGFGALLSAWSAGMVLGSLVFVGARRWPLHILVVTSTAIIGISYLGMGAVDSLLAACAFSVLGGVGNGIQWISVITAIQTDTPADLQARVMNVLESLNRGMPAVGFLLGGVLTALFSAPVAFFVAGAGVLVLATVAATLPALSVTPPPQPAAPSDGA
jgi:MFS family permease